jgi:putative two-component system response regulator
LATVTPDIEQELNQNELGFPYTSLLDPHLERIKNSVERTGHYDRFQAMGEDFCRKLIERESRLGLEDSVLKMAEQIVRYQDGNEHISRIQRYLSIFVQELKETDNRYFEILKWDADCLIPAAIFHDIGMVAVDKTLISLTRKLSKNEFSRIKMHPWYGGAILGEIAKRTKESPILSYAKIFAETHHERWNGSGYPRGLRGGNIPLPGRVLAIVDTYDALVSELSYKRPIGTPVAKRIIVGESGISFDPVLVKLFGNVAEQFAKIVEESKKEGTKKTR